MAEGLFGSNSASSPKLTESPMQEVTVRTVFLFTYGILFWIEYQSAVLAEGERGQVLHKENQQHRELPRDGKVVQAAGSSVHQQFTYR